MCLISSLGLRRNRGGTRPSQWCFRGISDAARYRIASIKPQSARALLLLLGPELVHTGKAEGALALEGVPVIEIGQQPIMREARSVLTDDFW